MNEVLNIKWDSGYINIYMPAFFPCTIAKYEKLLKIIRIDWYHPEYELKQTIQEFFTAMIPLKEDEWKQESRNFYMYQQKEADMEDILEDGKYPNGIRITKQQRKDVQKWKAEYTAKKRAAKSAAIRAKKDKEWFEKMVIRNA